MEKSRHHSVLWTFWPWYFRKGCLGPSSSSGSPDKFGWFSPGFRSPSYWLRTPNFIWQCTNIHRPPVKIPRGSWLKDTGISSVERHLVVKTAPANALDTGLVPGLGGYHVSRSNKPVQHKYWACALKLVFCNKSSCSNEKPAHSN